MLFLLLSCGAADDPEPQVPDPTIPIPPAPAPAPDPEPPSEPWTSTTEIPPAAPPSLVVAPDGAAFSGSITVVLATDPGVEIRYTLDGSDPADPQAPLYAGPLELTTTTTLRARVENAWGAVTVAPTYLALAPDLHGFSSDLPIAVLWSTEEAPESRSEVYTPYTFSVFEPAGAGRVALPASATLTSRAGLRVRGSSSAGYPKRPYRLELWAPDVDDDEDRELLGMPSDADWVLTAPLDFDRALMRNALMYALSNQIGRYAPRTRFVEMFVAERGEAVGMDDHVGVYVVTERVERGRDRVDITEMSATDITEPEVTGGWLFKEDRLPPDEVGFIAGAPLVFQQPFVYEDPAEIDVTPEQATYLTGLLDGLASALAAGQPVDATIDVDAWIDHHILNLFAKNPDAFRLSGYLHQDRGGRLVAGPLWDFDRTMGCAQDPRASDPTWWDATHLTSDTTDVFEHGFWGGLFDDPAFRAAYFDRMAALLANELSVANVHATIDAMAAELDEAAARNYATWSSYPPRGGSFESEVQRLQHWVVARHAWMQDCLELADPMTCTGD